MAFADQWPPAILLIAYSDMELLCRAAVILTDTSSWDAA
jgi:hypothetical protein